MAYVVSLKQFDGPLDLLLTLISRAKIDICDIFVSEITEQYLEQMQGVDELDMDSASEFLQMAATLLEIKSRALLPKPPKLEEGEEDPQETLLRRLEEYKRLKEAGERLRPLEKEALDMLFRLPQEMVQRQRLELNQLSLDALQEAFLRLLQRPRSVQLPAEPVRRIRREQWSVARCAMDILQMVMALEEVRFEALFEEAPDRERLVSTFIAMLELLKNGRIRLVQRELCGPILLYRGDVNDAA